MLILRWFEGGGRNGSFGASFASIYDAFKILGILVTTFARKVVEPLQSDFGGGYALILVAILRD